MDAATWAAKTTRAEAGKYVIEYHVKDASQNSECSTPKRTVIVRDTLPPVISLHLDKKLIHVSDATQTGLSNAQNSAQANRAGDAAYNPNLKDMVLMAEQSSASTNSWLLAARLRGDRPCAPVFQQQARHARDRASLRHFVRRASLRGTSTM